MTNRSSAKKSTKTLFVTVGSTKFEPLIDKVLTRELLGTLKSHQFTDIKLQCGNGNHADQQLNFSQNSLVKFSKEGLKIVAYDYKSSIREDMDSADLIISHAGAGSVMESLSLDKRLVVVVNEQLMDNHQLELAEKMFSEGFLLYTDCEGLLETIEEMDVTELKKYVPGKPELFGDYISKMFV